MLDKSLRTHLLLNNPTTTPSFSSFNNNRTIMQQLGEKSPPPSEHQLNDPFSPREASLHREFKPDQEMGNCSVSTTKEGEEGTIFGFTCPVDLDILRIVIAEMLGTFILMFCVCGIIASTQLAGGQVGLAEYAATAGLTIIVIVYSIGHVSGAHVNPSVSIAFAALGKLSWARVGFYIIAQLLGSIIATYVGKSVYGIQADEMITQPIRGFKTAFWAEFIATAIVMFSVSGLCEIEGVGHLAGFLVGAAIALAILITGPVSGGSLNPARSLGPALVSWRFNGIWLYLVAPTAGAVVGGFLSRLLSPSKSPSPK